MTMDADEKKVKELTDLLATERDAFGKKEIELINKLKELTALHAEVSGRNVTLHCKNLEIEGQVKILTEGLDDIAAHSKSPFGDRHDVDLQWRNYINDVAIKTLKASEKWVGRKS